MVTLRRSPTNLSSMILPRRFLERVPDRERWAGLLDEREMWFFDRGINPHEDFAEVREIVQASKRHHGLLRDDEEDPRLVLYREMAEQNGTESTPQTGDES